jgi:cardiolipin synthase
VASEIAIRFGVLVHVTRRRRPTAALVWLLVVFFQPWIGLAFYLLIGQNSLPRRRIEEHAELLTKLEALRDRFEGHPYTAKPAVPAEAQATLVLAERIGYMGILSQNDAEIIVDSDETIDRLIADIDTAEHHVHLLFYIFVEDETGNRVAEALLRAVKRGVRCRVLVDAVGSKKMLRSLGKQMREWGIEVAACLPVRLYRVFMKRMDLRNHRKVAVIDGRVAYTGSQNIVSAGYGRKDMEWRDMMVRMTGPIVLELQVVFLEDWYFDSGHLLDTDRVFPDPVPTGSTDIQTLPSGPNYPTENYQRLVVSALHTARERVIITTPYFVPDLAFLQALEVAALRGVQVDLVVPQRCDQIVVGAAARGYYEDLLSMGVNLHLHTDGLLHAKTMSIDDSFAFIGSSNFDIRSFALNFEINMIFFGADETERLRVEQERFIEQSRVLTLEEWQAEPAFKRIGQNIAKLMSPLL